jgi:hypothetical protein
MSRVIYEVRRKDGSFVSPRLGSSHHSNESQSGLAELAIGGLLFLIAAGFVFFVLTA